MDNPEILETLVTQDTFPFWITPSVFSNVYLFCFYDFLIGSCGDDVVMIILLICFHYMCLASIINLILVLLL
jgi:hypothetical protein